MTPTSSSPHVLILGAGLGGLTLAQALRKNGISYEIFDRDRNDKDRWQGWVIGLHSMLDDLKASLPDDMPPISDVNHLKPLDLVTEMAWYLNGGTSKIGVRDDGSGHILRANRARLREWLSTNIPIQFNKRALRIEEHGKMLTVYFNDGSSATGDIVVGADGTHSMTRKHILNGRPDPIETHPTLGINVQVELSGRDMEDQLQLGHSAYAVEFHDNAGEASRMMVLLVSVAPDGKAATYVLNLFRTSKDALDDASGVFSASREELYRYVVGRTSTLPPKFRAIVEKGDAEGINTPPLRFFTVDLPSMPAGRVTLLGDAAHAMAPFRGEGGAHALQDSLNLARALAKMDKDDDEGIKESMGAYQEEMLERGGKAAKLSRDAFREETDPEKPEARWVWGSPMGPLPEEPVSLGLSS